MEATTKPATLRQVPWSTIVEWAGTTIAERGRRYARAGHVQDLAVTADGALLAWVEGAQRYATLVDLEEAGLLAACTCPYAGVCKHAVALLLAYQAVGSQQRLPTAAASDPRLALLDHDAEEAAADDGAPAAARRTYLEGLPREALVRLLDELAGQMPAVADALTARQQLAARGAGPLVQEVRRFLHSGRPRRGWRDDWDDGADAADYDALRDRLTLLLAQGYADAVVDFADELLTVGNEQVGQSQDEGELMAEVASCMTIAFQALAASSLPPAEQMLRAIDWELADEYDLTGGGAAFWSQPRAAADWSAVADDLLARLAATPTRAEADDRYAGLTGAFRRERLAERASAALEQAGRAGEIIPLWEREAVANGSYPRLVARLIAADRRAEAEDWIRRGLAATGAGPAGPPSQLRQQQIQLWTDAQDWARLAAYHAAVFLANPSLPLLRALRAAAEHIGVWPAVRAALGHYLETGEAPAAVERTLAGAIIPAWPLPASELAAPPVAWQPPVPMIAMLIELAIDEGRPDEVLRWYDRRPATAGLGVNHDHVARAVAADYPERAVAIWRQLADAEIARTNVGAYETAAGYLREIGRVRAQQGRLDDWRRELATLRQEQRRKRRLVESLDQLATSITPTGQPTDRA